MGYFRPTFYYPVSDSFKDWNRLGALIISPATVSISSSGPHSGPYEIKRLL